MRRIASRTAMESKHWSENCVCANRIADAAGRGWNAAPLEPEYPRVAPGEQYFAGSFLESGLARVLERYETVTKWKALKRYKLRTNDGRAFDVVSL